MKDKKLIKRLKKWMFIGNYTMAELLAEKIKDWDLRFNAFADIRHHKDNDTISDRPWEKYKDLFDKSSIDSYPWPDSLEGMDIDVIKDDGYKIKGLLDVLKKDVELNNEWVKTDEGQILHRALLLLIGYYSTPTEYKKYCDDNGYTPINIMAHHHTD